MRLVELQVCPICASDLSRPDNCTQKGHAADSSAFGLGDFVIKACKTCELGFTSPVPSPETAGKLYDTDRDSRNYDADGGGVVALIKDAFADRFIRRLAAGRQVKKVLDYSTGNGRYAAAVQRCFPNSEVVATDYQLEAPKQLNATKVRYIQVHEFIDSSIDDKFDLIILRHVLEHSYTPKVLLSDLRDRLSEGGQLYVEVPNFKCAWAPLAGRFWPGYYTPYHIWHFGPAPLERIVKEVGMGGSVQPTHMPMIGNAISHWLHLQENLFIKFIGAILFPLQWATEVLFGQASAIYIRAERTLDLGA